MSKLFKLYWPGLKPGFLICVIYPFLAYIIAALAEKYADYNLIWLLNFPVMLLLCASPIMLTKQDHRSTCAKLHVHASEKMAFLLLNFWVFVPAIIFVSLFLPQLVSRALFNTILPLEFLLLDLGEEDLTFNFSELIGIYLAIISIVTVSMYYVVKIKKNRGLGGFIASMVLLFLIPVFGGIVAVVIYLLAYFKIAQTDLAVSYESYPMWTLFGIVAILAIIGLIYFIKLYKRLGKSSF